MQWRLRLNYTGCFFLALLLSLGIHIMPIESHATSTPPDALVAQGRDAYQAGLFTQAIAPLEEAVQIYDTLNAPLNQALALSYLALTYQELGNHPQAASTIQAAVALVPSTPDHENEQRVQAQVFNTYGELQLTWGKPDAAVSSWQTAAQAYQQLNDQLGIIGTQINHIQALRALGHYRQTKRQTEQLEETLDGLTHTNLAVAAWRSLGNTQYAIGDYDAASHSLTQSLTLAQQLNSQTDIAAAFLSLGNLERALGDRQLNQHLLATRQSLVRQSYCPDWSDVDLNSEAREHYQAAKSYYQQVRNNNNASRTIRVRSHLNHLSLDISLGETASEGQLNTLYHTLQTLPPSRFSVYANVHFAQDLMCLPTSTPQDQTNRYERSLRILNNAIHTATDLGDIRAKSYALGSLGQWYELRASELTGDAQGRAIAHAKTQTDEAMKLAQQIQAADIAYRWQWQMGRVLKQEGKPQEAIAFYATAFDNLRNLRSDLVVLDTDIQFAFRERIEPLYRQFADLLLKPGAPDEPGVHPSPPSQANLRKARDVLEALQLAELDNFFRDACSDIEPESLDTIIDEQAPTSAVLYSIILPDRLDLVLKLPKSENQGRISNAQNGKESISEANLRHYATNVSSQDVRDTIQAFRQQLLLPYTSQSINALSQKIYGWLIEPIEADLQANGIDHIVFVLDGVLRNIPMAVLYDGDRYLVDRYAISLSPGLQLLESDPSVRQTTHLLAAGISEQTAEFPALPNVERELTAIANTIPTSTQLLNQDFTELTLKTELSEEPISIVHLATHGQFSSQVEETFILTYDNKIGVNELSELLRNPNRRESEQQIELLVLSACQTAIGDQRATLGLAGVAVRAGARSTLASLWSVDDEATALLISEFYRQLYNSGEGMSKAEALKRSQQYVKDLEIEGFRPYAHPRYWSAFVLLGNWM